MIDDPLSALALITIVAFSAQALAARLHLPSVVLLLLGGIGLGTILDPDELFGELLFTIVGLGVAVLLFEGGTSLRWRDLTIGRAPVIRLVTIGALIAWAVGAVASYAVLDVDRDIAVLIGAILIVSGPTVVLPLLEVVRAREPVDSILRWEGIVIDPIGAGVAIVVLDAIVAQRGPAGIALRVITTYGAGLIIGATAAALLIEALRRRWIADTHHIPATLATLVGSYALANELRPEAGLIAVTILGIALANQRAVPALHIAEFNEHLGVSVLGVLFVLLGARVNLEAVLENLPASVAISATLILVARPLAVLASTVGTRSDWRARAFLMGLAPRGVVAAAVASLFAIELSHAGIAPGPIVPVVFTVVVLTVTTSAVVAALAAAKLRIKRPPQNGLALIGGGAFSIELADALAGLDVPVLLVRPDSEDEAIDRGLLAYQGRLDTEEFSATLTAVGVGAGLSLSSTDHLDRYATERLASNVDTSRLFTLSDPEENSTNATDRAVEPRPILPKHLTPERMEALLAAGRSIRTVRGTHDPDSDWLTICQVDENGGLLFEADPQAMSAESWLVQVGPDVTNPGSTPPPSLH